MPAAYNGDFIDIWYPGTDKGRTREGTAALSSVVDVPVDAKDTDGYRITVTLSVLGDELGDDVSVVGTSLDEAITPPMALHIVGCPRKARAAAEDYYWANKNSRRGLDEVEENPSQLVVMKNWSCVKETCDAGNRCDVKCTTPINYMGDLGFILVENLIAWSLKEYLSMMDDVTLWYPIQQITDFEIEEFDTSGPNIDGINDAVSQQSARKMKAGPFIGAATGLLALLLLLVLFVRRRNRFEETVSHLKLDEEDDETYYNGSEASTPNNKEYNTRDTHIVGEADSVVSHWTGYTGNNRTPNYEVEYDNEYNQSSLVRGISTDVHQCSSATCEICAKNRQAGLNFVPSGIEPVRSTSIPSDASRGYAAEDTVEL